MLECLSAIFIGFGVSLLGMIVNYANYTRTKKLLLAFTSHQHELTMQSGFGLRAVTKYPKLPTAQVSHKLVFDFFNFICWYLAVTFIIFLLVLARSYIIETRK